MSLWSQAKFEFIVNSEEDCENSNWYTSPSPSLAGIKKLDIMPPVIGYRVENKPIGLTGKLFTGVVMVPSNMTSGDCFKQLSNVFGSQDHIERIIKVDSIQSFKTRIEKERKDLPSDTLLKECKARLLDGDTIKWWKLTEVEKLMEKKEVSEAAKFKDETSGSGSTLAPQVLKEVHVEKITEKAVSEEKIKETDEGNNLKEKLNLNEVEIKKLKGKLSENNEEMSKKNKEIEELKNQIDQIDSELKVEIEQTKKVVKEKDEQVVLLGKEIEILEDEIKSLKSTERELMDERMNWNQDFDSQTVTDLHDELSKVKNEKKIQEDKLIEVEGKHAENTKKLEETERQLKDISDNCSYLQTQLVTQKKEMEDNIDKIGKKLIEQTKETEKLKEELNLKTEEVEALKQTAVVSAQNKKEASPETNDNFMKEQFNDIWKYIQDKEKSKPVEVVQMYKPSSAYANTDVQVQRVRSKEAKCLMIGHPELFRNIENIPSLKKVAIELIKSDNLEIITSDYEGYDMKKLVDKVSGAMEKTSFSEATQAGKSKIIPTTILIFPGNHYTAQSVNDKNAGKANFVKKMKMKSSADALAEVVVEILSSITGKEKQVMVVVDPATDETYEYSMIFVNRLTKGVTEWKEGTDAGLLPNILVWNLLDEQKNAGMHTMDKRNTIAVEEEGGMAWLDKASLTTDRKRVSKLTTIKVFNRAVDLASDSRPPAEACKQCGIQQSSSYGSKCLDGDTGEYLVCPVCQKDAHNISNCWSLKFQSDKLCKHRSCVTKKLKHSVHVHDIMDKKYQEEAVKELKHNIDFCKVPRLKRPFRPFWEGQDGPEAKKRKQQNGASSGN